MGTAALLASGEAAKAGSGQVMHYKWDFLGQLQNAQYLHKDTFLRVNRWMPDSMGRRVLAGTMPEGGGQSSWSTARCSPTPHTCGSDSGHRQSVWV